MPDKNPAYPLGYLPIPGIKTLSHHTTIPYNGSGRVAWIDDSMNTMTKDSPDYNTLKDQNLLNPDLSHPASFLLTLSFLADRIGLQSEGRGALWFPATKGKCIIGWHLKVSPHSGPLLKIPDVSNPLLALTMALSLTQCECAWNFKSLCPLHGDNPIYR